MVGIPENCCGSSFGRRREAEEVCRPHRRKLAAGEFLPGSCSSQEAGRWEARCLCQDVDTRETVERDDQRPREGTQRDSGRETVLLRESHPRRATMGLTGTLGVGCARPDSRPSWSTGDGTIGGNLESVSLAANSCRSRSKRSKSGAGAGVKVNAPTV